ncbi:MAG TPA: aldolase/citrate lyase family protein [bacterium]|nr:aldolase/citrate lyase family protein [bacterium]HPN32089.1 aldolase/citrate lyase family protein [bacterium]
MNKIVWLDNEKKLRDMARRLKEDFGCDSLKVSTEDAGMSFEEISEVYRLFNDIFPIAMKIGGPEARNDIHNAVQIGVAGIIAPMIESVYSLEKFIVSVKEVAGSVKFYKLSKHINIETISACERLDDILASKSIGHIDQATVGRSDLSGSINEKINSDLMMRITKEIVGKCKQKKISVSVGGNITPEIAVQIAEQISPDKMNTREVGFTLSNCKNIRETVSEVLKFEMELINHKIEIFNYQIAALTGRAKKIENRLKQ